MGLFDWIFGQFIDVIEWTDNSQDTMLWRFNRHNNEIKYGAKLTVRETQIAVFVNEGEIADILTPGIYELETNNLPVLTSLKHWDHAFNSPFKAEIYFLNTKRFTNLKWGTKNPIMVRDFEFDMVRLRAFGTYEIRIKEPEVFIKEIVGTDGHFTIDEIDDQLTNLILTKFATLMGQDNTAVLDMAANYERFGEYLTKNIEPFFEEYGLELTRILVENISLPQEVEKALDKRSSRAITGDLDAHIKYQSGEALGNSDGAASDMVGMGAGLAMGQMMAESMKNSAATPPPLNSSQQKIYHLVLEEGRSSGPYDLKSIQSLIDSAQVERHTPAWREGLDEWSSAIELFPELFKKTPPPLK